MMNAGKHVDCIGFDLHPTTAAVALLTAPKLPVDERFVYLQASRQP
jgi:hypothetical protein